ncbi:MAG: PSD1 domain-containing protein [Fuerstia sp.]|nr:PSD1 domain-containing protein [Fuerstiella sp.]
MTLLFHQLMLLIAGLVQADDAVDYQTQVRHVFQARCFACHGALKQESGLRIDTAASAIGGGDSGPAIVPGDAAGSELFKRISASDLAERMPPEGEALEPEQIDAIRRWINEGAKAPADEAPESDPRDHWAFRPPVRSAVPQAKEAAWNANPIDAFIAASHERHGVTPQPAADKRIWLRRVSVDLIGLPPTLDEQSVFINDTSPDAYNTVVAKLLASPQYGERWGRHWMDIWRYSDWWGLGAEVRNSQKHIWHWRDWIIEALNSDKAYDQMLREMLAADELYPSDPDRLRASGFLARQYFKFNRTSWMDETVQHTSKAFLGLTFNCAKCHDHKYDPISHVDYYQMRAFFEPYQVRTDLVGGELDFEKDGLPRAFDCNLDTPTYLHIRGDDRNPDTAHVLHPAIPKFLACGEFSITPVALPAEAWNPGLRQSVIDAHLQAAERQIEVARKTLVAAKEKLAAAQESANADVAKSVADGRADEARVIVSDDFSVARPEFWEQRSGNWKYTDGHLVQSQTGSTRATLRLIAKPPQDFQATLKYVPTGGDVWKSVGIAFDVEGDSQEVMAYLSSYAGGPKAQVSFLQDGKQSYPPDAAESRMIALNMPHELTIRVRGTLINVAVDGMHSVAYRLPFARRDGPLDLITFDAQATFLSFTLTSLPETMDLQEPAVGRTSDKLLPVDQAVLAVRIAEAALEKLEAEPASIQARSAADRAMAENPDGPESQRLVAAAVKAERIVAAAAAAESVYSAELNLLQATDEKRGETETKLADARKTLEAARAAIDMPGSSYASLKGSLKTLESNLETEESRSKPFPKTSTGRRTALAHWMTHRDNPLTARVAVNHIWARHFGTPLVPTVFDFGRKGLPPTHPELLDWLAVEFIESGWSMKHIHHLIVTSNTYRMTSTRSGAAEANQKTDGDNRWYWRTNPIRMEAQLVRDGLLHLAGELDLTLGGPSIPVSDEKSRRRSLYYVHSHNEHQKFLSMFDDASVLECYRRADSIVPQQALALENSELASELALKIAAQVSAMSDINTDEAFVRAAFQAVLSVDANEQEVAASVAAMQEFRSLAAAPAPAPDGTATKARTMLIHALINHNDFVTIR